MLRQMRLAGHDRYAYRAVPARPRFAWTEGRRLAVYIALNIEHYAFGEGLVEELAPGGPQPDVLNYAWRDYGNRVGAWRLIETFDALGLPLGALLNTAVYEAAPDLPAAFRARGDEIVCHGRTNSERQVGLPEAEEKRLIAEATAEMSRREGRPPQGWLGPWISETAATPDLLQEAGYGYVLDWCSDDLPFWLGTRGGRLLALPYPQELNDSNVIVARHMSATDFADAIVDDFDVARDRADAGETIVLGIALHAYIAGQPFRLRRLRRAFAHIARARDAVWIARPGDIAARYAAAERQGEPAP